MNEKGIFLENKQLQSESSHAPKDVLLRLKVLFNPQYFVPNKERSSLYLRDDREDTHEPDFLIPIGVRDSMRYSGSEEGGVSHRRLSWYQTMLFEDEYEDEPGQNLESQNSVQRLRSKASVKKNPEKIFGGYQEAFKAGKTVLDMGSGQALADIQLALDFPETSFIGVDALYQDERVVFPKKTGLQLTKGDWRFLKAVPDASIDTVLSCQGIGMWGLPGSSAREVTEEDGKSIISALNRVTRLGSTIRIDYTSKETQKFLKENMNSDMWEIQLFDKSLFIARRKS